MTATDEARETLRKETEIARSVLHSTTEGYAAHRGRARLANLRGTPFTMVRNIVHQVCVIDKLRYGDSPTVYSGYVLRGLNRSAEQLRTEEACRTKKQREKVEPVEALLVKQADTLEAAISGVEEAEKAEKAAEARRFPRDRDRSENLMWRAKATATALDILDRLDAKVAGGWKPTDSDSGITSALTDLELSPAKQAGHVRIAVGALDDGDYFTAWRELESAAEMFEIPEVANA